MTSTRLTPRNRLLTFQQLESRRVLAAFIVNSLTDGPLETLAGDGLLSLREAVEAANKNISVDGSRIGEVGTGGQLSSIPLDTIFISVPGEIELSAGELDIVDDLTIVGNGINLTTIDAKNQSRIFDARRSQSFDDSSTWFHLSQMRLENGTAPAGEDGGAIYTNVLIGKELYFENNSAENGGAVAMSESGLFQFENSVFENNSAANHGGALLIQGGGIRLSSFVGNSADVGGAIYYRTQASVSNYNNFFGGNSAQNSGAGIHFEWPSGWFRNSILAGNHLVDGTVQDVSSDSFSTPQRFEFNVIGVAEPDSSFSRFDNTIVGDSWQNVFENDGTNPILALNGGNIPNVDIAEGSPAIDAGDPDFRFDENGGDFDLRGVPRPIDGDNDSVAIVDAGTNEFGAEVRKLRISAIDGTENGEDVRFEVTLDREPQAAPISVQFETTTDGTAVPNDDYTPVQVELTFQAGEALTQTITVPLLDNDYVDVRETIVGRLFSPENAWVEFGYENATANVDDDEIPSVIASKSEILIDEAGTMTDSATFVLGEKPAGEVWVYTGAQREQVTADPLALLFTPENWNVPQEATYQAIDDDWDEDDVQEVDSRAGVAVVSGKVYPAASLPFLNRIIDDDTRGVIVTKLSETTSESGDSASFEVRLTSRPTRDVRVHMSSSDDSEGVPEVESVLLSRDWTPDSSTVITVNGVNDDDRDGAQEFFIEFEELTQADYAGIQIPSIRFVNLDDESPAMDFGDAPTAEQSGLPSSYPTLLADSAAAHTIGDLFLGAEVNTEDDGQPDAQAALDSDDGIRFISGIVAHDSVSTTSSATITASQTGKLDAWIDFNRDGDWDDAGEQIATSFELVAGGNHLAYSIPAGAVSGESFARFRISETGGLNPSGIGGFGEVEDYAVSILPAGNARVPVFVNSSDMVSLSKVDSDILVMQSGNILFRAPVAELTVDIGGNSDANSIRIESTELVTGTHFSFDGAEGVDLVEFAGAGHSIDLTAETSAFAGIEHLDIAGTGANSIRIHKASVLATGSGQKLRIVHSDDDTLEFTDDWQLETPVIDGDQLLHQLSQDEALLEIVNDTPHQNPFNRLDVELDGSVSAIDALIVIDHLNTLGGTLPPLSAGHRYIDVNGDNSGSAIDALLLIDFLNRGAEGEGEASSSAVNGWAASFWASKRDPWQELLEERELRFRWLG
ncbi:MAG: GEVED domain-containing protein [Planctomycetota bacterium]